MTTKVETLRDFSLFQTINGNRNVNEAHVKRLTQSIGESPELVEYNPILVNEKMEVIDGQHRLEALKRLDLPIPYIKAEGLDLKDVQKLNSSQKVWSPVEYAKSYSDLGIWDYAAYLDIKKNTGLNHDTVLSYCSFGNNLITGEAFRTGKMKIRDLKKTEKLCKDLAEIGQYYLPASPGASKYKKRAFTTAFKKMWEHPEYDQKQMVKAMVRDGSKLADFANWLDAIRGLEQSYNKYQTKQVRFF